MRWTTAALLFLLVLADASAQRKGAYLNSHGRYKKKFTYASGPGERVLRTWCFYVVSSTESDSFLLRVFYPETGRLTLQATYVDESLLDRSGPSAQWYDDGSMRSAGHYHRGKREGTWRLFEPKGSWKQGRYGAGLKEGTWEMRGSDSTLLDVSPYEHDLLHGWYIRYDSLGADSSFYERGKLITPSKRSGRQEMPSFGGCASQSTPGEVGECSNRAIFDFLKRTVHYPDDAYDLEITGEALIEFTVDEDGAVTEVRVLNGVCRAIEAECLRVMGLFPRWSPGRQDGKPVKCRFTQPIGFKLR